MSEKQLQNARESKGGIKCYRCGKPLKNWTRIHYIPIEKNRVREYKPVCRECELGEMEET